MRSIECLYHHRCVFAGVVIIAALCSLKHFLKIILQKYLLNLEIRAGNTSECNLEKWKLINLSYTLTSLKRGLFFFFSFNTIFSGCILIPDAFQGIWAFCKSWAFQSSCLWHRNKIGYINLSWKTRNLSGNTNSSGQMSCHLEDVLPTVLSGLED